MRLISSAANAALLVLLTLSSGVAHADFEALAGLAAGGAMVSAVAVDLDSNRTLAQLNPRQRLTPASVTKLVVSAKALETWPANQTFATHLYASAAPVGGVVNGDVLLITDGDVSLEHKSLIELASQLRGAGITRINGRVAVSTAPFGALGCETKDRCDALAKSSTAYNAPIAGLGVDYGSWCIEVHPTAPRKPAQITSCDGVPLPIPVEGMITTVGAGQRASWWIDRRTTAGEDSLSMGGTVPMGDFQTEYRAMSDAARGAGLLMRETLRAAGVAVTGGVTVRATPAPATAVELARVDSLELKEQLARMLRYSNNYVADMLTMNMAAANNTPAPTLADAAQGLSQYVAAANADPSNPPSLYSGSGLTPESLISAQEIAAMLASEHRNTRNFPAYYSGLVVPRQAPFRFLRGGSAAWMDRTAIKPGTMNDPRSVCGIAGYLRKQDGGFIAFATLVNGGPRQMHVPLYKAMEAIKADVDALAARY